MCNIDLGKDLQKYKQNICHFSATPKPLVVGIASKNYVICKMEQAEIFIFNFARTPRFYSEYMHLEKLYKMVKFFARLGIAAAVEAAIATGLVQKTQNVSNR